MGLDRAKDLLRDLKLEDHDIEEFCTQALENLQRGESAFLPDQPITGKRVRDVLRYWRSQNRDWLRMQEETITRRRLSDMRKMLLALLEGYLRRRLAEPGE
jgi:hypothetical protein